MKKKRQNCEKKNGHLPFLFNSLLLAAKKKKKKCFVAMERNALLLLRLKPRGDAYTRGGSVEFCEA